MSKSRRNSEFFHQKRNLTMEIDERARTEQALRESEERYRVAAQTTGQLIYDYDLATGAIKWAGAIRKITGYLPEEFRHVDITSWEEMIHPEDRPSAVSMLDLALQQAGTYHVEYRFRCKDGTYAQIEDEGAFLKDESGKACRLGAMKDVGDRKRVEQEKRDLEFQLQRAQKMEAIGTLAGGVAHDLNNILTGIVSYPDLLLLKLPEDSPLRKPIETIKETGQRAAVIVQDLLTLARRGLVDFEVVSLNSIICEYLSSPEHRKLESLYPRVRVEIDLEADLLNMNGSAVHLSKTLMNLVRNAAEAMPSGGRILISTENRYVDRGVRGYDNVKEGDYVLVKVSDNGTAIPARDLDRVFEPFYTTKVMGRSGTGLGMAVVWGTVKDHNGYIDLESTVGKGTTVRLYFPMTRKTIATIKAPFPLDEYGGIGESILVIDDMKEQREIAVALLSELGYSVHAVSGGQEAIDYLKEHRVDLLVLDMIMDPGMDGLNTYEKIIDFHPGQKAIITSGFSETERVKEAQRLGAGQYIKKPFTLEKIAMAVRNELARKGGPR